LNLRNSVSHVLRISDISFLVKRLRNIWHRFQLDLSLFPFSSYWSNKDSTKSKW
ncbi:unnamed protein product, partial [Brassica rapa]